MSIQTESRQALRELIALLQEADERWAGPEWNLASADDVAGAHRALMHMLEGGLVGMFESDPAHPQFRRIVTPSRKFTGDNADAIYFDAPVSADHTYTVRGTYSFPALNDDARGYVLWGSDGEGFQLPFKATEVLMEAAS